jgi:hypothetical protein
LGPPLIAKGPTNLFGFFAKHDMKSVKNLTTNAFRIYSMAGTKVISSAGIEFTYFSSMLKQTGVKG